ncbi:hypothetical protein L7F22_022165 [Adiantum nelumboides]|nr:hypothetical protein [Adiantum nelumboides]
MWSSSIRLSEAEVVAALSKWWISVSVMLSLLLQLLLLLTGGTRKWNRVCRFIAWNAYNWSDYVATTALGAWPKLLLEMMLTRYYIVSHTE